MQRVHSGNMIPDGFPVAPAGQGGVRMDDDPDYRRTNEILSIDMTLKLGERGHTNPDPEHGGVSIFGAKGFGKTRLGADGAQEFMIEFADAMHNAGLARHDTDRIAADLRTAGTTTGYAREIDTLNGGAYRYWKAVASCKDADAGGLDFRKASTGHGVYEGEVALIKAIDGTGQRHSVALQGGGNVAAWYGHFASHDPDNLLAINYWSEADGLLWTPDPEGFKITADMAHSIGDNPATEGMRAQLYRQALEENYRRTHNGRELEIYVRNDPGAILEAPVDDFVPAAYKYPINERSCSRLGARFGVFPGANNHADPVGFAYMEARGLVAPADHTLNGQGLDVSVIEIKRNVAEIDNPRLAAGMPVSWDDVKDYSTGRMNDLIGKTRAMQAEHQSRHGKPISLRVAANLLAIYTLVLRDQ
jgi:glutamate dehydrogenase/leucine dehydrogenase